MISNKNSGKKKAIRLGDPQDPRAKSIRQRNEAIENKKQNIEILTAVQELMQNQLKHNPHQALPTEEQ